VGRCADEEQDQAARLREEGHVVEPGKVKKRPEVRDFDGHLL